MEWELIKFREEGISWRRQQCNLSCMSEIHYSSSYKQYSLDYRSWSLLESVASEFVTRVLSIQVLCLLMVYYNCHPSIYSFIQLCPLPIQLSPQTTTNITYPQETLSPRFLSGEQEKTAVLQVTYWTSAEDLYSCSFPLFHHAPVENGQRLRVEKWDEWTH